MTRCPWSRVQSRHVPGAGSSSNLPRRGRYAGTVSRIIAGRHGGRRIKTPPTQLTRPTTDRVREAVFSAIASWNGTADEPVSDALAGIAFADLFAGSGDDVDMAPGDRVEGPGKDGLHGRSSWCELVRWVDVVAGRWAGCRRTH